MRPIYTLMIVVSRAGLSARSAAEPQRDIVLLFRSATLQMPRDPTLQLPNIAGPGSEDDASVRASLCLPVRVDAQEIAVIVGQHCTPLGSSPAKLIGVGDAAVVAADLSATYGIVAMPPQLLGQPDIHHFVRVQSDAQAAHRGASRTSGAAAWRAKSSSTRAGWAA